MMGMYPWSIGLAQCLAEECPLGCRGQCDVMQAVTDPLVTRMQVERDVQLVGVTAIEDKLQDGVPAAIQTLLDAGMRVRAAPLAPCTQHA